MKSKSSKIGVILIEDQPIAQMAIKEALIQDQQIHWLGEADDGAPGIALIQKTKPDVAIVDYHLKKLDGLELIEKIRLASPQTIIVSLTQEENPFLLLQMIESGSKAILTKSSVRSLIKDIYTVVIDQKTMLQEELGYEVVKATLEREKIYRLNNNEKIYFLRTGQGKDHIDIANEIGIKPASVKKLLTATKKKLNIKTKDALIALYKRFFPGGWRD